MDDIAFTTNYPVQKDEKSVRQINMHTYKDIVYHIPNKGVARIEFDAQRFLALYRQELDWCKLPRNDPYRKVLKIMVEVIGKVQMAEYSAISGQVGVPVNYHFFRVFKILMEHQEFNVFSLIENKYIQQYTFWDYDFVAGPLAGEGFNAYLLPTGEEFYKDSWIY